LFCIYLRIASNFYSAESSFEMDEKLEAAWVAGLREGDAQCYQSSVETTIGRLLNVARGYLGEDEARDAVQET
jgi:hypothetical protein